MADTKKYLHNLNVVNNKVMNLLLNPLTTAQRTTIGGTLGLSDQSYVCYDTDLDQQYFWDGTQWITVGGGITGSGTPTQIAFWDTSSSITSDTDLYWDNVNKRLGLGTSSPVGKLHVDLDNIDYVNTAGANSHLLLNNPNAGGQTSVTSIINGNIAAKWRTDYVGNINWAAGPGGSHAFYTDGDYGIGQSRMAIFNNGNVLIKNSGVGGANVDAGYKLDVSGTGRFTNNLFADTNLYVNNYFQIDTTATAIPSGYVGIWRRKGNGYVSFFMEDEQGAAKDKWAFVKRQGYNGLRDWYQTNSSIVNINYGWGTPNSSNYQGATLLIDPTINITNVLFTGTIVRGIYYNPTLTSLTNTTHIAYQNTSGDIIHGNLATGGAAQMVTADTNGKLAIQTIPTGTVTSVDLTMPSAFNVTGNPVTTSGTLAVTGAGTVSQYVRGDGSLANFPNSTGGGASVNYYLNGSVSQGTFGGDTYYEMSKTPILGAGTNFTRTNGAGNGYIASFITDAGDPNQLNIPGGNWNLEFYFNSSASGGTPSFYAELYKVSATNVFTLIASGSANPEGITNGTAVDQYFTSLPVPQTTLLATDRLAIRIFVTTGGRTITFHTENGNLAEVLTTLTTGLTALNGLTEQVQNFAVGTSGTDFGISSSTATHTFNLPTASATNRGALSTTDWTNFNTAYTNRITSLTTTGTSGAATLVGNTLNIPQYSGGTSYTFSTGLTNSSGTVTSNLSTGVSGGQSVVGGTAASNSLTLSSTSNATKGKLLFGTSAYDEVNNRLGIGTTTPTTPLDIIRNDASATNSLVIRNTSTTGANGILLGQDASTNNLGFGWFGSGNATYKALNPKTAYMYTLSGAYGLGFTTSTTSQPIFFCTDDWTERMRVSGTGNLLINTTTDAGYKLDVNGTARAVTSLQTPTLLGNTTSGGTLTLQSTSNATKGKILFGTSAYDEVNNRLGIGTTSPAYRIGLLDANKGIDLYSSGALANDAIKIINNSTGATIGLQNTNATGFDGIEYIDNNGNTKVFTGFNNNNGQEFRFNNVATNGYIDFLISSTSGLKLFNSRNIGVGQTSDAGYKLDVNGTARFSSDLTAATGIIVSANAVGAQTQIKVGIATTATQAVRLTSAGSNIIPEFLAYSGANTAGTITYGINRVNGFIGSIANSSFGYTIRAAIQTIGTNNTAGSESGDLIFLTQSGGTAMSEKMRITGTGFVGINSTSPANTLDVIRGSAGTMGRGVYETASFSYNGDMKFGLYTASSNSTHGAGLSFGQTNLIITANSYYPGFDHQYVYGATPAANAMRYNYTERNSGGTVVNYAANLMQMYGDGKIVFSPVASGVSTSVKMLINTSTDAGYTLDVNGTVNITGSLTFTPSAAPSYSGEIVKFGTGTLTAGQLYYLNSSGVWTAANATSATNSTGMLGIAVGTSPTTNGLLIRGFAANSAYTSTTGSILYVATSAGSITSTAPTGTTQVVRVVGYQTSLTNTIYFNPDATWVTLP